MMFHRWKRQLSAAIFQRRPPSIRVAFPGWSEAEPQENLQVWRGPHGAVLSIAYPAPYPDGLDEFSLVDWCRGAAESRDGGLIEARMLDSGKRPAFRFIYKRLLLPAYVYTGIHVSWRTDPLQCTVVAGECQPTGVREAIVTHEMFNSGKLDLTTYERDWAQDPYDPSYRKVDRSVLRFISDDESYDAEFPEHPLSRVRSLLRALPDCLAFD